MKDIKPKSLIRDGLRLPIMLEAIGATLIDTDLNISITTKFKIDATSSQTHMCSVLSKTIHDAVIKEHPIEPKASTRKPSKVSLFCSSENLTPPLPSSDELLLLIA